MRLWVGLILTLFLCAEKAFGQEAVTVVGGDVVGPLPATAQFGRFEAPVPSLATGAVNFPVNLYRIEVGEVEIPISLCYSTQGIKVYDDKGLLRFVLPPEASAKLAKNPTDSKDIIANLCYTYTYDDLNRCVSKKLPGCEPVQMRYDRGGRRRGFVQGKWRASTAKAVCW